MINHLEWLLRGWMIIDCLYYFNIPTRHYYESPTRACAKFCANWPGRCGDISLHKWKIWPVGGAIRKVRALLKSLGFSLWVHECLYKIEQQSFQYLPIYFILDQSSAATRWTLTSPHVAKKFDNQTATLHGLWKPTLWFLFCLRLRRRNSFCCLETKLTPAYSSNAANTKSRHTAIQISMAFT